MKKIFILSMLVILGALALGQAVYGAGATLSVLPTILDTTVGKVFNVSIQMDPAGNKVCVVKGVLSFNNLSCQNITVQSGVMAQTNPTCSSPSFMLGIPKCEIADKNILSVSVKGNNVGTANLSLSAVKVIGAGSDIAFNSQNGVYNIIAVQTQTAAPQAAPKTRQTAPQTALQTAAETTPEAGQQEVQPAEVETQTAALLSTPIADFFNSPLVIIILAVILVSAGWWLVNRFFRKKTKN